MTATTDLLDAQAFERRRLVAAFLTGRCDASPPRTGRLAVIGLLLSGLLLVGAVATGLLLGRR